MNNVKLVICDVDGTLIDADEAIPSEIQNLAVKLSEHGIIFTIATGRMPYEMEHLINFMGIKEPCAFGNGALISKGKDVIAQRTMCIKSILPLINEMQRAEMSIVLSLEDGDKVVEMTPFLKEKALQFNRNYEYIQLDRELLSVSSLYKVQVYNHYMENDIGVWTERLKQCEGSQQFNLNIYGNLGFEISPAGIDKSYGLKKIAAFLNISTQEILAIGDQNNDIEMIMTAGIGVSVANASDALKGISDYICTTETASGVIEAIKRYCELTDI